MFLQKKVITKARPVLDESIVELCTKSLGECIAMAELGCASGSTTLLPLWEVIETMDSVCSKLNKQVPTLMVFLNDLSGNDFNTIFRSIVPDFQKKLKEQEGSNFRHCFIAATAGSFYGRLFPPLSLNFVHSSYSLHWLSQVPKGVESESGIPMNKGNICIAKTSPPSVEEAYMHQFERDFTTFLRSRAVEMVEGGHMVLIILGKSNTNIHCQFGSEILQLIGNSLFEMVQEGLIEESTLDSFNMPFYNPSLQEVKHAIESENSLTIKRLEEFEISWDGNIEDDKWKRGKFVANYMRAVTESMLETHFGDGIIMDNLFNRLSYKYAEYLEKGIGIFNNFVISIGKK